MGGSRPGSAAVVESYHSAGAQPDDGNTMTFRDGPKKQDHEN